MKQQILDALKAKFTGVSESILGRIADRLAKTATTAEEVETAVAGVTFQQVLESYGDSRATEAQATAVKNYEAKHGLKDGKPQPTPTPQPQPQGSEDDNIPAWAKKVFDAMESTNKRLEQMESQRKTTERRQQLSKLVEKLPQSVRKVYDRTPVETLSDEDFNSLISEVGNEVTEISQAMTKGASSRPFMATPSADDKLTDAQLKAITKRSGVPGADGQPF